MKQAASGYANKAHSAAEGAKDAAASAGHKAGQHASAAAGAAAGTAQTKAGGVPLWGLAAAGIAAGAVVYYGFKASPGSHGADVCQAKLCGSPAPSMWLWRAVSVFWNSTVVSRSSNVTLAQCEVSSRWSRKRPAMRGGALST